MAAFHLLMWERTTIGSTLQIRSRSGLSSSSGPEAGTAIALLAAACGDSSRWNHRFPVSGVTPMATPGGKGDIIICMP